MVDRSIVEIVQRYLSALDGMGIRARRAILFGSFARGEATEWSDIDLLVIAPEFDGVRSIQLVQQLWRATAAADNRIEPIPCGEREWETEEGRPILDIARREGMEISIAALE
jgi:predicted nucleotidyltransferase